MRIVQLLSAFVAVCLIVSSAVGQSPAPPPAPAVAPVPTVNPYAETARVDSKADQVDPDRAEHLRLALEHLTAAGLEDLAKQLDRELLIETKLAQIRKLEAEIAALRALANSPQVLKLQLKIVELQTGKMREKGFEISSENAALLDLTKDEAGKHASAPSPMLMPATDLEKVLDALRESKLAKVLAEPTLVTVSGRPASFQSGGEIPIIVPQSTGNTSVEYRQTGTRVDCVGTILENGRIRLELCSTVSEVDSSQSILLKDISVPGLRTRKVDTAVEMAAGETVVLCGMSQNEDESEAEEDADTGRETSLLVAVTVSVVDAAATAAKQQPRR